MNEQLTGLLQSLLFAVFSILLRTCIHEVGSDGWWIVPSFAERVEPALACYGQI